MDELEKGTDRRPCGALCDYTAGSAFWKTSRPSREMGAALAPVQTFETEKQALFYEGADDIRELAPAPLRFLCGIFALSLDRKRHYAFFGRAGFDADALHAPTG